MALTTSIGVFLSASKKRRMQVYSQLYEFNEQLLLNLKFSRQTIDKIAQNFSLIPKLMCGEERLGGQDGDIINDYFTNLGKSDAMSQIDYLNERKAILLKYRDESLSNYKKYSSLYIKIFFMLGVLMAVLLA